MQRLERLGSIRQHARYAFRRLRAAPGFSAAVMLRLALGIGATTTVFGVIDGILLRPLPFPDPERLVALTHTTVVSGISRIDQSDATFMLYQRHATHAFENIGAYRTTDVNLGAWVGRGTMIDSRLSRLFSAFCTCAAAFSSPSKVEIAAQVTRSPICCSAIRRPARSRSTRRSTTS